MGLLCAKTVIKSAGKCLFSPHREFSFLSPKTQTSLFSSNQNFLWKPQKSKRRKCQVSCPELNAVRFQYCSFPAAKQLIFFKQKLSKNKLVFLKNKKKAMRKYILHVIFFCTFSLSGKLSQGDFFINTIAASLSLAYCKGI